MHRMVLLIGTGLGGCLLGAVELRAQAQLYKVGDKVVVVSDEQLKINGNETVADVDPGLVLQVQAVNGKWLWLTYKRSGWLDQRHVVPLNRQAIERFTRLINASPGSARLYSARASAWMHLGELGEAIADFDEAIRLIPNVAAAYTNRGIAWSGKSEYDKAIADYNEAIRLDPTNTQAYNARGAAWNGKGEYENAIADYNEVIHLDPKYAKAYNNRGNAWTHKGEYDKAIADYNEAIRLDSKFALAYTNRGIAWTHKGEYDKAIADYNERIRLDPKDASAYNGLAWLLATCPDGRFWDGALAVQLGTKACGLTSWQDANHLDSLAAAYARSGDFQSAVTYQSKAVDLAPTASKADYRSRLHLYEAGQPYAEKSK